YSPELFGDLSPPRVRPEAFLVPDFPAVFSGAALSLDPRSRPFHLLLLPRRLLQALWGRSSRLLCWRAPQVISWRAQLPSDHAELSPLLSAPLLPGVGSPGLRRRESVLV